MAETTLKRLYYSLDQPAALSGVNRLYKAAKDVHPSLTKRKVERWLEQQDVYTLHKPARRKLRAEPRVYVKHIDDQWCIDLCDMQNVSTENDGVKYILTCIDAFSKYAWAVGIRNKSAESVADGFREILRETNRRPKRIESDKGKEFFNQTVRTLFREINAHHFSTESRHKSSIVERFNRTLKNLLYRAFRSRNTYRWIDILKDLLYVYNNRTHRSIKTAPANVSGDNERQIFSRLYIKLPAKGKRYKSGQMVRISKIKRVFDKGYYPNYTEEIYRIVKVHNKRPIQYELEDLLHEKLDGKFVAEELAAVTKSTHDIWRVEKVIKRDRRGRYFVKWTGFPEKFNSWVDEISMI
ncbi:MAG: DDE-type integrase/transposase/recombinase [Cyanophyceae cyanobacterium]